MIAIIDARNHQYRIKLYSVTLIERILRQLHESGVKKAKIISGEGENIRSVIRYGFDKRYIMDIAFTKSGRTLSDSLQCDLSEDIGKGVLFFEADGLYDDRVIKSLIDSPQNAQIISERDQNAPVAAKMDAVTFQDFSSSGYELLPWISQNLSVHHFQRISVQSMNTYIRFLRRHVTPYLNRVTPETDIRALENEMYANTFKGGMELVAAYGYRLPVRELTRFFARTRFTPNQATALSVIAKIAAIPAFFAGWYWTGLLLAMSFIILDSLDGKLARMTVRYSKAADRWDHLTSLPARMGWFLGMGWFFSGGNLTDPSAIAAIILTVTNFADKMVFNIFNAVFGRSPLDFTEFDRIINLFNVKRNDVFLIFFMSLPGFALESFYFVTLWTILIFLWRVVRTVWLRFFVLSDKRS